MISHLSLITISVFSVVCSIVSDTTATDVFRTHTSNNKSIPKYYNTPDGYETYEEGLI